jgi:hippurate hydrolase
MFNEIKSWKKEAISIRRRLHALPEIGFEEFETQKFIVNKLKEFGIEKIDTSFAKTSVIALIDGEYEGKTIGLRADMDALPIQEKNTFEYVSMTKNRMHACGHDGHMTMLLMAAKYLSLHRNFSGRVVLIFQPAEEGLGGAETLIIKEQVLKHYPLDAVFSLHNLPNLSEGTFGFKVGNIMASSDRFFISVKGKSGHAGIPHESLDPLLAATHIYQGIQGLVARTVNPFDSIVISITQIHAGQTNNIIPDEAILSGTIRSHSEELRNKIINNIDHMIKNIANAFFMDASLKLGDIRHQVTINSEEETKIGIKTAQELFGSDNIVLNIKPLMASEDFSFFLSKIPGCYAFIGNGDGNGVSLHNANYDFNDEIIPYGAAYFVGIIKSYSNAGEIHDKVKTKA